MAASETCRERFGDEQTARAVTRADGGRFIEPSTPNMAPCKASPDPSAGMTPSTTPPATSTPSNAERLEIDNDRGLSL